MLDMDFNTLFLMMLIFFCTSHGHSSSGSENESPEHYVQCKQGWFLYGEKCYKILGLSKGLSWNQASVKCSLERGHLATIESKELQEFLTTFLLLNAETNAWIGLHDREREKHFMWDDGSIVTYTNWDRQEPTGASPLREEEDCAEMRFKDFQTKIGVWNDLSCTRELPYFCQVDESEETLSPDPRFCSIEEGGGWKYLNSCYHIVTEEKSWEDAEKHCEEYFKGFLVTILNKKAETFLNYVLSNVSKDFWIGIKMQDHAIQKWTSGWHVVYKKWDHEQKHFLKDTCGLKSKQNVWTIAPCFRKLPFVCERLKYNAVAVRKTSSEGWRCPELSKDWLDLDGELCYFLQTSRSVNWYEANYECGRKGGTLVSIHSEADTNILHPFVINTQERLFIGLHRNLSKKDVFEWADGSAIDYLNWKDREPNSVREECGELWTDSMQWNDISCDEEKGYICSAKKLPSDTTKITASQSEHHVCPSGISAKNVMGIIVCTLLVAFLTGVVVYYSRDFCKKRCNIFARKDFNPYSSTALSHISSEVILKPEELERRM